MQNIKLHKTVKTALVILPVFAFTVFLPSFENQTEAQTPKQPPIVLGAFAKNDQILNQQNNADFNIVSGDPRSGDQQKQVEAFQVHFDKPLDIPAKSFLVYEPDSGKTLISRNVDQKLPIASLTKLMTSIIVSEDPNYSQPLTITEADRISVSPVLGLRANDVVMPKDLVKAALIGSANDAAWTLGNHFSNKEEFVQKMNAKAQALGMINTQFDNAVGFDSPNNYSTAEDLQKLVQYAMKSLPYDEIWQQKNYSFKSQSGNSYYIKNSNGLVSSHPEIKSIKTGQTPGALGNMIVQSQSSTGTPFISIVLGSSDRNASTLEVLDYIFSNFVWK